MKFFKAQTNGNDFIIINESPSKFDKSLIIKLADRKFGVGCDQLIFVQFECDKYVTTFYNNDGSYANMCGNGACAVAKYIKDILRAANIQLSVNNTLYKTFINDEFVTVRFSLPKINGDIISTGNSHIVRDMDEIGDLDNLKEAFPECNIHFIKKLSQNQIRVKTFERGSGWTLACGSGAIAVGFYSGLKGKIEIHHDGGISFVDVLDDSVNLTTRPKLVFEGIIDERFAI